MADELPRRASDVPGHDAAPSTGPALACYSGHLAEVLIRESHAGRLFARFDIVGERGTTSFIAWPRVLEDLGVAHLVAGQPLRVLALVEPDTQPFVVADFGPG